jgi:adenosylmethionine-8-amino-7-oxononanoate aminotransferase
MPVILATDTDAGKTTLALLWLTAFADEYEYWKPVETGPRDSSKIAELVPGTVVHPAVCWFPQPLAPPLAARLEQSEVPAASVLAAAKPSLNRPERQLLVESFGGPFSPLNETELQISLIRALQMPALVVCPATLGAVGRTLQCISALTAEGLPARAVVLMGEVDSFAVEMIRRHRQDLAVFSLRPPRAWTSAGLRQAAAEQIAVLTELRNRTSGERAGTPAGSATLEERDRRSVWHPYTPLQSADLPLACDRAQDEFLFLEDGRRVIDGISSWWTILHGHRYPPLMDALRQAMQKFDHVHFAGVTHAPAVELAELLLTNVWGNGSPASTGRVFYSDDGSTAVEVALKMAYQFWCHHGRPERKRFIGFEHGYHGDTFGAMAVSRDPIFFGRFEPMLLQADILPLDPDRLDDHLKKHAHETAAVILEPLVQGAGGMLVHSPEKLRQIFEVTRAHDVLFIADEVMTGGGRTGTLWAHQQAGIAPELICAGKTLTGGVLPLAATLVNQRIVDSFDSPDRTRTFFHGHSFTAHPLACAVAAANWKLLLANTDSRAQRMEAFWRQSLDSVSSLPQVREVRICGSIAAVEMAEQAGGYLAEIGHRLRRSCLEDGVLLRPLGSVLYAMPPLGTSNASLEKIAGAMIRAVSQ